MQSLAFLQMPFIAPCCPSLRLHSFLPPLPRPPAPGTPRVAISAPHSPHHPPWAPPRWRAGGPSAYSNDQSLRGQGRSERAKEQSVRGAAVTQAQPKPSSRHLGLQGRLVWTESQPLSDGNTLELVNNLFKSPSNGNEHCPRGSRSTRLLG